MTDLERLRALSYKWMTLATTDAMSEKRRAWTASNDLKAYRPLILFESVGVDGYIEKSELVCQDAFYRSAEKNMLYQIKRVEFTQDDAVIDPYFRLPWKVDCSSYGVDVTEHHVQDRDERDIGFAFLHPVQQPEDVCKLKQRTFCVDRAATRRAQEKLSLAFGEELPVRVGNVDIMYGEAFSKDAQIELFGPQAAEPGFLCAFTPFLGDHYLSLPLYLYKLLGNNNFLYWTYDHPDAIHAIMQYLSDDRLAFYRWMEREQLLDTNADSQRVGSAPLGFVSDLPSPGGPPKKIGTKDTWCWAEAQEADMISPEMFEEFILPYLKRVTDIFGLVSYGCCECLDAKLEAVKKAMPNLRNVSISPWSNLQLMAEKLGREYVLCKKPNPAYLSGKSPDWESAEKELRDIWRAAKNCNLQIIYRDMYDVNKDLSRLPRWVALAKNICGI